MGFKIENGVLKVYNKEPGVTDITIPEGVTEIDYYVFYDCKSLTSVTLPKSMTEISYHAFGRCKSLTSVTIPDSVIKICGDAFRGCTSLTSVTIPDSVKEIGESAFLGCESLTSITIPDSVKKIGKEAFSGCTSLSSIIIPDSVNEIGKSAFCGCTGLTSVTIPDSVTIINRSALQGCTGLTTLTVDPNNTKYASENSLILNKDKTKVILCAPGLTSVTIPDSVTEIGESAFRGCKSLTTITIPDGVKEIGESAFLGCESLTTITIPDSVKEIGSEAFWCCTGLTSVTIPNGVTIIDSQTFWGCESLTSIKIPDSVKEIGSEAFLRCESLTSITIPDSVAEIGGSAFKGCTGLNSVTIPDSVTEIGWNAFKDCTSLASIIISSSVTKIERSVFEGCTGLTSITIPNSVTEIGNDAFKGCMSLTSVTIINSVTKIDYSVFEGCTSLETINVSPAFSHLDKNRVRDTKWYKDQTDLVILGAVLIEYKGNASEVTIPDSVKKIGRNAFKDCTSLTSIMIPGGVTEIGGAAFSGCTGLSSITIPDSMTEIGGSAFKGCTGLTSITIPEGVTEIYSYTFYGCSDLRLVTLGNGIARIAEDAFKRISNKAKFLTPNGLPNADERTIEQVIVPNWKKFDPALIAWFFINGHSKSFLDQYSKFDGRPLEIVGMAIPGAFGNNPSAKQCTAAADFISMFYTKIDGAILRSIMSVIRSSKNGRNAFEAIKAASPVMEKMGYAKQSSSKTNDPESLVLTKASEKDIFLRFKKQYKIEGTMLPEVRSAGGKVLAPYVLAWLCIVNDEENDRSLAYKKPGVCPDAAEVIETLDRSSFQTALISIADEFLGKKGKNAQHHLAYPLCRYADEKTLSELCSRAPKWRSSVSGNDAPALREFRKACKYSTSRQAIFFAEKYKDLYEYARIRGTDEETVRDTVLSDVGLEPDGTKKYDLGNQTVTVRMQPDYSFEVELENGKTAKSIPKKGADEAKYEIANADFSDMKKNVKKIVKNRFNNLFEDFLSGRGKPASSWDTVYTTNPVLKQAAMLIVWAQKSKTFIMTSSSLIDSEGKAYTLSDDNVVVAHPMEMDKEDIERWQKYFTSHGLKQPFIQIWEPVRSSGRIKEDRYKEAMIPYYRFLGQEKHGITVTDSDFHGYIDISFKGLDTDIDRIDYARHSINPEDRFKIKKISFSKYTRQVNHEIAYLDKVTVWGRIKDDDQSIADMLTEFTLAQITEFIKVAQEAKAVKVLALLMEYKNKTYSDYDPMDEFTLDW